MVIIGGTWALFQRHLGRILGYAVMVEIGMILLSLGSAEKILIQSSEGPADIPFFFSLFFARFVSLGVWALSLSAIHSLVGELRFSALRGIGRQIPFASASLFLAYLSLVGFPVTIGFSYHLAIWSGLAQLSPAMALASLLGCAGLLLAGIRSLAILLSASEETTWAIKETRSSLFFLVTGVAILILAGIYIRL
jgi:formate hydrogenlyase subunit 3/multisubunit Na+/H+ antiporter MnhD subunit